MKKKIINTMSVLFFISTLCAVCAPLTVESDKQEFKDSDRKIYLEGNVNVKTNDVNVKSPRAVVEIDPNSNKVNNVKFTDHAYSFQKDGDKTNEVKAQILEMSLLQNILRAEGNTVSSVTEKDKPVVVVTADKQEYHKQTNTMKAFGEVTVLYNDMETFSNNAVVDLTSGNDVKRIVLNGNASLKQNKSKIKANKLDYDNIKEVAVASGNVYSDITTDDGKRIEVWSDYQSYNKKTNVVSASGNSKIKYEDYIATGPKVIVYGDSKTDKLNEAVFSGRSKIETKGRTIEADRITITMEPKDFKAEGNVKSVIPNIH